MKNVNLGSKEHPMLDVSEVELGVQVDIHQDGKVLWVSVDGLTLLRISDILALEISDARGDKEVAGCPNQ